MTDHRIRDASGQPLPFSCQNSKFRTAINKGVPHGTHFTRGAVTGKPLVGDEDGISIWLEHVEETGGDGSELYWLMWYDRGAPTIPLSSVFGKAQIEEMARQLVQFVP